RPDLLPPAGGHPGPALLPQPRRRAAPLPRRRTAAAEPSARARPGRPRRALGILLRAGDRGRVQRLQAALGPAGGDRRADPPAFSGGDEAAARPLRPLRAPRVPALPRRPPDQLPDLADAAAGRARTRDPQRLAGAEELPDPGPRRRGRRHHLGCGGAAGEASLPPLAPLRGAGSRPRLEPLLPFPLAGGRGDPALHRLSLTSSIV